jgi:aminoglycoside 6'-N-acetyltransferase I
MGIDIRLLGRDEAGVLERVATGVFDDPVNPRVTREFLSDPRHHVAVALDEGLVVGSVTGVHYLHPDMGAPELWINELAVAPSHQGRGLAQALLGALLEAGRELGCGEAWVLTDRSNAPAMRVYSALGGVEAPMDQVMFSFNLTAEADAGVQQRAAPDGPR